MPVGDEKVSRFMEAITAYAEARRKAIHQEVEDYKALRLREAEQAVLRDAYTLIHQEQDELRKKLGREMARRDIDARKELLTRRKEIVHVIFNRVESALRDFVRGEEYVGFLTASLANMRRVLPGRDTVYAYAPGDTAAAALAVPEGCRFEPDDTIVIGGLRGSNRTAGVILDDTLDMRLTLEHEWFVEHAGLHIG